MAEPRPNPVPTGRTARRLAWEFLPPARPRPGGAALCGPRWCRRSPRAAASPRASRRCSPARTAPGTSSRRPPWSRRPPSPTPTARRLASWPRCRAASRHPGCCGPTTTTGWCSAWSTSRAGCPGGPGGPPSSSAASPPWRRPPGCSPRRRRRWRWTPSPPSSRRSRGCGRPCAPRAGTSRTTTRRPRWPSRFAEVTAGDTLVHTDIRDDNLILGDADQVWICDWNWPVAGAAWLDTVFLLLAPSRRRSRRRGAAGRAAAHPRRARRVGRRGAGAGGRLLPPPGRAADPRPRRRTSATTSAGWAQVDLGLAVRASRVVVSDLGRPAARW